MSSAPPSHSKYFVRSDASRAYLASAGAAGDDVVLKVLDPAQDPSEIRGLTWCLVQTSGDKYQFHPWHDATRRPRRNLWLEVKRNSVKLSNRYSEVLISNSGIAGLNLYKSRLRPASPEIYLTAHNGKDKPTLGLPNGTRNQYWILEHLFKDAGDISFEEGEVETEDEKDTSIRPDTIVQAIAGFFVLGVLWSVYANRSSPG
ncbi:hypothetical protein SISSUDRAFT_1042258 [Sistotremastrum suecicum HHB10207 ss-3]|uniref:Uncharacterized protein n=1 Tax=Sistotremastrum suecicum HHB10207 ss-3 TaxID=1314776 RepID=A0A166GKK4_9AGAM|nr:hypothetical protein SISSUDRAFT_1042258 [Sistotremastrum suecicum HHB10207 ss-3]